MCFIKVKEEDDYTVPARVVRRERKTSPPTQRRSTRISHIEPQHQSIERTYVIQAPQPPPPPSPPPPPRPTTAARPEPVIVVPALSPQPNTRPQTHYVEVSPGSVSSASSSDEHAHQKTTSKSRRSDPQSEYHFREREYRKERGYSPPGKDDNNYYRYVRAPPGRGLDDRGGLAGDATREGRGNSGTRGSFVDDPRASRTSYRRERERVVVVDNDGRRTREYRR